MHSAPQYEHVRKGDTGVTHDLGIGITTVRLGGYNQQKIDN